MKNLKLPFWKGRNYIIAITDLDGKIEQNLYEGIRSPIVASILAQRALRTMKYSTMQLVMILPNWDPTFESLDQNKVQKLAKRFAYKDKNKSLKNYIQKVEDEKCCKWNSFYTRFKNSKEDSRNVH